MLNPGRLLRRAGSLLAMRQKDEELDEELRFHIEMETARRVRNGMDPVAAAAAARRDFGGVARYRDETRDARGVRAIEELLNDLRIGMRTLFKQKTYAIVSTLTLAIGIGATTALGSAVYEVLLAPLPFRDAERLVGIGEFDRTAAAPDSGGASPGNIHEWTRRSRSFELIAAAEPFSLDWIGPEGPERFENARITRGWFELQGIKPLLGRLFLPEEYEPGRDRVVLFGEGVWRSRFGADSTIIGRTMILDSVPKVVVGIIPSTALPVFGADSWVPKTLTAQEIADRRTGYFVTMARLRPSVTIEAARREMDGIALQLADEFPATNRNTGVAIVPLRERLVGGVRNSLLLMFGAVAFVLVIACVNVANLQLAESVRRRRELALRSAIGAGRGRLVRQLLAESLLLASLGAVAGLGVVYAGLAAIRRFVPPAMWQLRELELDGTTFVVALALVVLTSCAITLLPALEAGRMQLAASLAHSGRMSAGHGGRHANRWLVVAEVALSLVLLVGAGLMVRSLSSLMSVERGFNAERMLVAEVQAWGYYPTGAGRAEFARTTIERLRAVPGVEAVGMTSSLPLSYPIGNESSRIEIEGQPRADGEMPIVHTSSVSPGYVDAAGIRVLSGRRLESTDVATSPLVVLVNQAFVKRFLPGTNPLGKRVKLGFMGPPQWREIVGVTNDVRHEGLQENPEPAIMLPHPQGSTGAMNFVVRTTGDPAAFERRLRAEFAAINGAMPLSGVVTMESRVAESLQERRFQSALFGAFSVVALILSVLGIYGVMSRATSERTHEIGVRLAMGAHARDVWWMVVRNGGALAATGVVAGLLGAFALTRLLEGMLFDVSPLDPLTYSGAVAVLLGAGVVAAAIPAVRAAGVDPVRALRAD